MSYGHSTIGHTLHNKFDENMKELKIFKNALQISLINPIPSFGHIKYEYQVCRFPTIDLMYDINSNHRIIVICLPLTNPA